VSQLVFELSVTLGLAGALLVGVTALVQGHGFWTLALRSLISGGIFFLFTFLGGQLVARSLLERVAQRRLEEEEAASKTAVPEKPSPVDYLDGIRQNATRGDNDRVSENEPSVAAARASTTNRPAA
jgi:hypothetical protein